MSEKRVTAKQRRIIAKWAQDCCEYCGSQERFATQVFSVEHIIPRSKGGRTILDNLALACQGCNSHKQIKTEGYDPVSGLIVPLINPRKQDWYDHFSWSNDFTLIIGLTSTGRATIEALHLNREGLINLREVLYMMGEHPPIGWNGGSVQ